MTNKDRITEDYKINKMKFLRSNHKDIQLKRSKNDRQTKKNKEV
jgi:hypothetical protein